MKTDFKLRNAIPSESKYLTDLAARSKAYWPYDQDYLRLAAIVTQVTENDIISNIFRIIDVDGKIAGFYGLAPVNSENMLDHLWIEPEYIRKGLGKILFTDAVESANKMNWSCFTIASDPYAEDFYLKQGAIKIGERESKVKPGFFLPLLKFTISLNQRDKLEQFKENL